MKKLRFKKGKPIIKESHRGLLHEDLGVPAGQKITASKIEQATHSSSAAVRKRAIFARSAANWKH